MKRLFVFFAVVASFFLVTTPVVAGPAIDYDLPGVFVNAIPTADAEGNVSIPPMPAGVKLVDVEIYDDYRNIDTRPIGPKHTFRLKPGESFNFLWEGPTCTHPNKVCYQFLAPGSEAGGSLVVGKHPAGCKYLFPMK